MSVCSECEKPAFARGWCAMHYNRWRRGRPITGSTPWSSSPMERFLSFIQIGPEFDGDPCFVWSGSIFKPSGYGQFTVKTRPVYAHRWAYEAWVGPIPTDREIDHLCRNRACVNPNHLEAVTHLENVRRGFAARRLEAA